MFRRKERRTQSPLYQFYCLARFAHVGPLKEKEMKKAHVKPFDFPNIATKAGDISFN